MIFVCTREVAEVNKKTVVVMVYCIEKSFHSIGILCDIAMVLGACLNAELLSVISNFAAVFSDCGKLQIKALAVACLCKSVANVVTHNLCTECLCNIELSANSLDFRFVFFGSIVVEMCAYKVSLNVHAKLVCLFSYFLCLLELLFKRGVFTRSEPCEVDCVNAELLCLCNTVKLCHKTLCYVLCK